VTGLEQRLNLESANLVLDNGLPTESRGSSIGPKEGGDSEGEYKRSGW
jgi:hypothetical protein